MSTGMNRNETPSPKEKEKLKQRLQHLFKQQESRRFQHNDKKKSEKWPNERPSKESAVPFKKQKLNDQVPKDDNGQKNAQHNGNNNNRKQFGPIGHTKAESKAKQSLHLSSKEQQQKTHKLNGNSQQNLAKNKAKKSQQWPRPGNEDESKQSTMPRNTDRQDNKPMKKQRLNEHAHPADGNLGKKRKNNNNKQTQHLANEWNNESEAFHSQAKNTKDITSKKQQKKLHKYKANAEQNSEPNEVKSFATSEVNENSKFHTDKSKKSKLTHKAKQAEQKNSMSIQESTNFSKQKKKFTSNTSNKRADIESPPNPEKPSKKFKVKGKHTNPKNTSKESAVKEKHSLKRAASMETNDNSMPLKKAKKQKLKKPKETETETDSDDSFELAKEVSKDAQLNKKSKNLEMSGLVRGGDYDVEHFRQEEDEDDDDYWLQNGEDEDFSDSDDCSEEYSDLSDYSDYEEYNSSDDYEGETTDDEYDEEGEDYDYSSSDEFSLDRSYDSYEDTDYELPESCVEDLIVHSGVAIKRDLLPEDNVQFKDDDTTQIIELEDASATVKIIEQPMAYNREELLKAANQQIEPTDNCDDSSDDSLDSCPRLVPIVDEDGFQLCQSSDEEEKNDDYDLDDYSDEDSGSWGSEIDSEYACSIASDINEKYRNRNKEYDAGNKYLRGFAPEADVIDASKEDFQHIEMPLNDANHSDAESPREQQLFTCPGATGVSTIISAQVLENKRKTRDFGSHELTAYAAKVSKQNKEQQNQEEAEKDQQSDVDMHELSNNVTEPLLTSFETRINQSNDELSSEASEQLESPKSSNISYANYQTIFCNAIDANMVLVLLKQPFYIYGTVRLTLLAGHMEIYGHSLELNRSIELFSPRGCSNIEIAALKGQSHHAPKIEQVLQPLKAHFLLAELEKITAAYNPQEDAIVLLQRNDERQKMVQQFSKFMNENVFPNLQNITPDRPLYNAEYILRCMINISAMEQRCLHIPALWQTLEVQQTSRIMLAGGKGVGKSTLLRYLLNRHLAKHKRFLLIDLDIGQPEVFVPQSVSCTVIEKPLMGPGIFQNLQPLKAFAVGHTNIALCPHRYVQAVHELFLYCQRHMEFANMPWLINTMGYNKGFGLELMAVLVNAAPLTHLIQLQSNKPINNFDQILDARLLQQMPLNMFAEWAQEPNNNVEQPQYRLHLWNAAVEQESRYQKEWYMSPKDMRYANLLTRLSAALPEHAEWLTDCSPMSAPLDEIKLLNLTDDIPEATPLELAKAMEANLVYMCHYVEETLALECLGIGVVRAIDYHVQQVYLVPATLNLTLLERVNCLALCDMPLPSSVLTNQGSRVRNTVAFVYNTVEDKASKAIKQIYHRSPAFLPHKRQPVNP